MRLAETGAGPCGIGGRQQVSRARDASGGRHARGRRRAARERDHRGSLGARIRACRDDGPLAVWIGEPVQGRLPPLLPAVAGITVTAVLAVAGMRGLGGLLLLTPVAAMLLAALGAGHPHEGRHDWLVPVLLQAGQWIYLAALGFAAGVPGAVTVALLAAVALRPLALLHWQRNGIIPAVGLSTAGLGWEGRMLAAGIGGMLGAETFVYIALAGWLWALFGLDSVTTWLTARRTEPDRP